MTTLCQITGCGESANAHYSWGSVSGQKADLCAAHGMELWDKSPPHVKDRFIIAPIESQPIRVSRIRFWLLRVRNFFNWLFLHDRRRHQPR